MGEALQKIKPSCLEINVCGRIESIEQIQGKQKQFYATTVIIPAEDTFSRPIRVQVNSKMPFGEAGVMVDTLVHVVPQWRSNNGKWFFSCNLWKDKLGA
jgi:hypothetical protein